jgi:hypothetical protein
MNKTLDNVFMGVIFVVGIILSVISIMADKSASNFPTCYTSKVRTPLRLILVLGVILAVSSISFAVCQYNCAPCGHKDFAINLYLGISLVLAVTITGLSASLNKELDATKCPAASKMATALVGMGATSIVACLGMIGYQSYEYKNRKTLTPPTPPTPPTSHTQPPTLATSSTHANPLDDQANITFLKKHRYLSSDTQINLLAPANQIKLRYLRGLANEEDLNFQFETNQEQRNQNAEMNKREAESQIRAAERLKQYSRSVSLGVARDSNPQEYQQSFTQNMSSMPSMNNNFSDTQQQTWNPNMGFKGKKKSKM